MNFTNLIKILATLVTCLISHTTIPAYGIYGGSPATGNPVVVGLLSDQFSMSAGCSGALVAPRMVMTAAHCLTPSVQNLWVAQPGSDLRDTSTLRIQSEKYFIPADFTTSKFPYQNDFAIIVLKYSFANINNVDIATSTEVKMWTDEEKEVMHVGYGCTELVDSPPCRVTSPLPNKLVTRLSKVIPPQFSGLTPDTFSATKISVDKTICGGDSGSPLFVEISGRLVYIGAQSSSNGAGCTKSCNLICVATQGLPSANISLVEEAKKYISQTAPPPSQTDNPEIKATPTPVSRPSMSATVTKASKKTILCVKGKSIKKVVAVTPKCPTGFKKR